MCDCVEFCHLKYFLVVAQEGNFTCAAERLHLSQPSLSTQIKQFEESMSAQLFVREKSGVMLTPAGNALMPFAEQVLRLREQAVDSVRAIHKGTAPPLALLACELHNTARMRSNKTKFPTKIKPKFAAPQQPNPQMKLLV